MNRAVLGSVGYVYMGVEIDVDRVLDLIDNLGEHVVTMSPNDLCTISDVVPVVDEHEDSEK